MKDNFYKSIIKGSSVGYAYHKIIIDSSGTPCDYEFIEVNQAFEKITGLKSRQIIGKKITDVLPAILEDKTDWVKTYGDVALNNKKIKIKSYSSVLNSWYNVEAFSPQKYYFVCLFYDVTKEKYHAKAIEELFLICPDLICFLDNKGNFLDINNQWTKSLGYSLRDLKNKNVFDIIHHEDIESTKNILCDLSEKGAIFDFVNRIRCKDKSNYYKYLNWHIKSNEDVCYCAARDITNEVEGKYTLNKLINISEDFLKTSSKDLDYKKISENLMQISSAKNLCFLTYTESLNSFKLEYISEHNNKDLALLKSISGIDFLGSTWSSDHLINIPSNSSLVCVFDDLNQLTKGVLKNIISNQIKNIFGIGDIVIVKIEKDNNLFGFFVIVMEKGKPFNQSIFVEIYARQVGLLFDRIASDKKNLELLKENEMIFNSTQDALFLVQVFQDERFVYIRNNISFEIKTGIKSKDFIGKTPFEVFGQELGQTLINNYKRCIKERIPIVYEDAIELNGKRKTWLTSLTPVFRNGEPLYIVGSKEDITPQILAQNQINYTLKRREMLLDLVSNSNHSIETLFNLSSEYALNFSESQYSFLFFYNQDTDSFALNSWSSIKNDDDFIKENEITFNSQNLFLFRRAINQKQPIIINNFDNDIYFKDVSINNIVLKKMLVIPIVDTNNPSCLLVAINKTDDYTQSDVLSLNFLMSNVCSAYKRKKSQDLLNKEKEFFKTTLLSINDGIVTTDNLGKIIILNENAQVLTGFTQEDAQEKDFSDIFNLIFEKSQTVCNNPIKIALETKKSFSFDQPVQLISKKGEKHLISNVASPIVAENGEILGAVLAFRDITQEKQKQDSIAYLSYHDQLTGLFNRRFFEEELNRIDTAENLPITIVMADVNGLKLTNDAFGHAFGDRLLVAASQVIKENCRQTDIIARIGGDEFVIIFPNTTRDEAKAIIDNIKKECEQKYVGSVNLSISFGQKTKTSLKTSMQDIFKKAENKMYHQKLFESPSIRSKTLQTISNMFYEANKNEERHSKNVGRICKIFGQALFFGQRELNDLVTAAYLHDIGKIALDKQLLNHNTNLSEEQWRDIKRHPETGYRILSSVSELADIAQYVLSHHEHWDGKGYPKGLKQNDIPLFARIISLADSYDVMTNQRPYHNPMSKEKAILQIKKNAGTQFDPDLAIFFIEEILNKDLI